MVNKKGMLKNAPECTWMRQHSVLHFYGKITIRRSTQDITQAGLKIILLTLERLCIMMYNSFMCYTCVAMKERGS